MEYLIRFVMMHETFRKPETDALAELNDIGLEWLSYSDEVGRLNSERQRASECGA